MRRFLRIIVFLGISVIFAIMNTLTPVYATVKLPDGRDDEFAENNILFYNPASGANDCFDLGGTGVVSGDSLEAKVWNYFVTAGISGVSDNAAVIAGIMGNLKQESGYNPFSHTSGSKYYGIYQTTGAMVDAINAQGWSKYWGTTNAPEDIVDKALKIELDYLTRTNTRFTTEGYSYLKNLNTPTNKTPEGYAELFEVSVEGAVTNKTTENNTLLDSGVIGLGTKYFSKAAGGGRYYQEVGTRRKYAKEIYDKYKTKTGDGSSSTGANTTDGSNVTMIGDSITVGSQSAITDKVPKIDIHAQVSKHFAMDADSSHGGDSGLTILKKLADDNKLRDILVFALGTNDASGFKQKDAEKVLEIAKGKTIIFVTNYTTKSDYTSNNNIFNKLASENSNVVIADWAAAIKGQTDKYLGSDGVHPNSDGQKLFAETIFGAINNQPGAGSEICDETPNYGQLYFWSQYDEPWASKPYGNCGGATIADAGCGPTSLAMVISAMTGKKVTPDVIAQQAVEAGYRVCGSGSAHEITKLAEKYGLKVTYANGTTAWNESYITKALKEGKMIHISSSGSNPFTSGGHFIAIRGITESGKWLIFDSGHRANQQREFSPSEILSATNRSLGSLDVYIVSK